MLEARGLLQRKGFPESYDVRRLVQFMADVKAGRAGVRAPVYSHQAYDIVPGEFQVVDRPDIVIVEGLNVLQTGDGQRGAVRRGVFVSDFFDFSIYIDAEERDIEAWYVARFLTLRETVFRDPTSYFHRYAALDDAEAVETAREIWRTINGVNLRENIRPTRERARLVLEKGADHAVRRVRLRTVLSVGRRLRHAEGLLAARRAARRASASRAVWRSASVSSSSGGTGHAAAPVAIHRDERQIRAARQLPLARQRLFREHLDFHFERRRERGRHRSRAG